MGNLGKSYIRIAQILIKEDGYAIYVAAPGHVVISVRFGRSGGPCQLRVAAGGGEGEHGVRLGEDIALIAVYVVGTRLDSRRLCKRERLGVERSVLLRRLGSVGRVIDCEILGKRRERNLVRFAVHDASIPFLRELYAQMPAARILAVVNQYLTVIVRLITHRNKFRLVLGAHRVILRLVIYRDNTICKRHSIRHGDSGKIEIRRTEIRHDVAVGPYAALVAGSMATVCVVIVHIIFQIIGPTHHCLYFIAGHELSAALSIILVEYMRRIPHQCSAKIRHDVARNACGLRQHGLLAFREPKLQRRRIGGRLRARLAVLSVGVSASNGVRHFVRQHLMSVRDALDFTRCSHDRADTEGVAGVVDRILRT